MEIITISIAAFVTAILTFFSGFGLGTILTPVFIVFFPVDLAIALTGVVHFFNNLFKVGLVGKNANKDVLIKFGAPAIIASFLGAWVLLRLPEDTILYAYTFLGKNIEVSYIKFVISLLLICFALMDLIPFFERLQFGKEKLTLGGFLSGFFGGLSGHQGALRSAFLIKAGLSKESFVGTAVIIACFIDFTRLAVYATRFTSAGLTDNLPLVMSATISAIVGAYIGHRLLKKVTLIFIQRLVAIMLLLISLALGMGII